MNESLQRTLANYLIAMADTELILGHRDSEWCGHAPILEEDIAFANLALDEIGHATLWYGLVADLLDENRETYPDQLAFLRGPDEYRNAPLVELPKGDWAFSMLRQYLIDSAEGIQLEKWTHSAYQPLAESAAKAYREEIYHLRHTQAWVKRLALGTDESHRRMQQALDDLWSYVPGYFEAIADQAALVAENFIPSSEEVYAAWLNKVSAELQQFNLSLPTSPPASFNRMQHTEYLAPLLEAMQQVARLAPQAKW
jgi:ring-1,2-phenylacetyl-CoA epoxidase subunit PaaC